MFGKHLLTSSASVIQWTVAGAAVAVPPGAILGACFGGVLAILYGDPAIIVTVLIHFLCCASAAGAILGAYACLVDGHSPLTTRRQDSWPASAQRRNSTEVVPTWYRVQTGRPGISDPRRPATNPRGRRASSERN
jgi:hypothetical protein